MKRPAEVQEENQLMGGAGTPRVFVSLIGMVLAGDL